MPTLRDAIAHASDASRLHFCIAWQHGDDEHIAQFDEFRSRAKLTILDIPYTESRGACWARHAIQQQYQDEAYTLQLDSHHRFVADWDDICIEMLEDLRASGVEKPLLTAYLPSYDPENDPAARIPEAWEMTFDRFIPEGAIFFTPRTMPGWTSRTTSQRARFYSAHFAFSIGAFAREVQHNPEYYFHGEEITIAVRAFTHGYDLFHPHREVAWHEYTRRGRTKHWDEHTNWGEFNAVTHSHVRTLFGMDALAREPEVVAAAQRGAYGLGSARTLEDYERYAGLCFRRRAATNAVLEHREPVIGEHDGLSYAEFAGRCVARFKHCIDVAYHQVPLDDYDYWCVSFQDDAGKEMFRRDADAAEIARLRADPDKYFKLWCEFETDELPTTWTVWPYSRSQRWCPPIVGTLR